LAIVSEPDFHAWDSAATGRRELDLGCAPPCGARVGTCDQRGRPGERLSISALSRGDGHERHPVLDRLVGFLSEWGSIAASPSRVSLPFHTKQTSFGFISSCERRDAVVRDVDQPVFCRQLHLDESDRAIATGAASGGDDLSAAMVRAGYALAVGVGTPVSGARSGGACLRCRHLVGFVSNAVGIWRAQQLDLDE